MTEPRLHRKMVEALKLLNVYLNHFPNHEKYALANQIRVTAYEVYDLITEGQKRYYKKTSLTQLDIAHEKLKLQIGLAYELGYFSYKDGREGKQKTADHRYRAISLMVTELGKMIGGWIKKIKQENQWK
jgi:four helix bundle protein